MTPMERLRHRSLLNFVKSASFDKIDKLSKRDRDMLAKSKAAQDVLERRGYYAYVAKEYGPDGPNLTPTERMMLAGLAEALETASFEQIEKGGKRGWEMIRKCKSLQDILERRGYYVYVATKYGFGEPRDAAKPKAVQPPRQEPRAAPAVKASPVTKVEAFKRWCLDQSVVEIEFKWGQDNFFVELAPYKLTTKANVQSIAEMLAKAYCQQVGRKQAVCHVLWGTGFVRGTHSRN